MSDILGNWVWYDAMTLDIDKAVKFYGAANGWGTTEFEMPPEADMPPYKMWTVGETPIGGVMPLPEEAKAAGAPPHWIGYIGTPDIEGTVKKAEGLGAKVMVPVTPIPTVGQFAILADPQGTVFATFQPGEGDQPPLPSRDTPGMISWGELYADDPDAAFAFYSEVFGWKETGAMDMGEGGTYRMYGLTEASMGGICKRPEQVPVNCWLYYATVADLDGTLETVKGGGGQVTFGPMEIPGGGRVAACMDDQGAAFAFYQE